MSVQLTPRGQLLRDALLFLLLVVVTIVALIWAWESGQNRQCQWYRQHRPEQAQPYCGP